MSEEAQRLAASVAQKTAEMVKLPMLENEVESGPFFAIAPWLMVAIFVCTCDYI